MTGRIIGQYEIQEKLGSGGLRVVFRAREHIERLLEQSVRETQ